MKKLHFTALHPGAFLIYFTELLITCFYSEIAGLAVIFVFLFAFSLLQKKARMILWALPLALFMLVLNPIFYHGGQTVLFTLWDFNFTWEAIENGIYSALLILCTMLAFSMLGTGLGEERFLYIFGRFFPKTALMVSMIFKHFDLLGKSYTQTKNMAKMNGIYDNDKSLWQKLKTNSVIFEAFTGAALEGSIDTALSLSAKGYYSKKKTRITSYRFHVSDFVFIAVTTTIFVFVFFKPLYICLPATAVLFLIPILLGRSEERK
ncbi:MAG: hypothetical protein IJJ41_00695 [Clostridia bacterium]|nr:hypothetical protein [Clostridia bacterium]